LGIIAEVFAEYIYAAFVGGVFFYGEGPNKFYCIWQEKFLGYAFREKAVACRRARGKKAPALPRAPHGLVMIMFVVTFFVYI